MEPEEAYELSELGRRVSEGADRIRIRDDYKSKSK